MNAEVTVQKGVNIVNALTETPTESLANATPGIIEESIPCVWLHSRTRAFLDRAIAAVLLLIFAPIILVLTVAVRSTTKGPAFYIQTRVGRGGRPFRIFKLRTMTHQCELRSGVQWSIPGDSRITGIGRILRATHLDELPQLLNVLRGEMSMVGPRPERPELTPQLAFEVPGYHERHTVRPGVTGLAQIWLPADTGIDSVRRKLKYDRYYIENAGIWTDIALMVCTSVKLIGVPPRPICWLFGVARVDDSETDDTSPDFELPLPAQESA